MIMKISIKQLSTITGFSPATISNALNKKPGVNKTTADIIFKAAVDSGYMQNAKITSIRLIVYKKHGIILADTPFFSELIAGVENAGREYGYETVICHLDRQSENYDKHLKTILDDNTTANLVLATELETEDMTPFQNALCPVVMIDGWFEDMSFSAVLINNTDAMFNATTYLIANGHTKIGYLKSSVSIQNFYCRQSGFLRALSKAGTQYHPEYIISLFPTMDGAYKAMNKYLDTQPVHLPTAFCADNDIIALGACKALKEHGYDIPKDVSVIGFDDISFCDISSPPLTTIRVFKQEMGAIAVRQLVNMIKTGTKVKTKVQICTEFVERESVKKMITKETMRK